MFDCILNMPLSSRFYQLQVRRCAIFTNSSVLDLETVTLLKKLSKTKFQILHTYLFQNFKIYFFISKCISFLRQYPTEKRIYNICHKTKIGLSLTILQHAKIVGNEINYPLNLSGRNCSIETVIIPLEPLTSDIRGSGLYFFFQRHYLYLQ